MDKEPRFEQLNPAAAHELFDEIIRHEFKGKSSWFIYYLHFAPIAEIKDRHIDELLKLYATTSENLHYDFNLINKLIEFRGDLHRQVLATMTNRIEKETMFFDLDVHLFTDGISLIDDLELVKKAYCQQDKRKRRFDHNFKGLLEIVRLDNSFLLSYLKRIDNDGFRIL